MICQMPLRLKQNGNNSKLDCLLAVFNPQDHVPGYEHCNNSCDALIIRQKSFHSSMKMKNIIIKVLLNIISCCFLKSSMPYALES